MRSIHLLKADDLSSPSLVAWSLSVEELLHLLQLGMAAICTLRIWVTVSKSSPPDGYRLCYLCAAEKQRNRAESPDWLLQQHSCSVRQPHHANIKKQTDSQTRKKMEKDSTSSINCPLYTSSEKCAQFYVQRGVYTHLIPQLNSFLQP